LSQETLLQQSKAEHQFLFALLILQFAKSILVVFFFPRLRSVSSERNQCSAIKSYSILDYKAAPVNYGHFILHARAFSLFSLAYLPRQMRLFFALFHNSVLSFVHFSSRPRS
jgi:hypothetical protein